MVPTGTRPSLRLPPAVSVKLQKTIVTVYRWAGLVVLAAIVVGLVSYLGRIAFFAFYRAWVAPVVVAENDPTVLELATVLARERSELEKRRRERRELATRLRDAERLVASERSYQDGVAGTLRQVIAFRKKDASRLEGVRKDLRAQLEGVKKIEGELIKTSRKELTSLADAHLVDRTKLLNGEHALLKMEHEGLDLSQRDVELAQRVDGLSRDTQALVALVDATTSRDRDRNARLTFEGLSVWRDLERSRLDLARAQDSVEDLRVALSGADELVASSEALVQRLDRAPLLRAAEERRPLAFIPYANVGRVRAGDAVYACRLYIVLCRVVGRVGTFSEVERSERHPILDETQRGLLAELVLDDNEWARELLLHARRPPLLF